MSTAITPMVNTITKKTKMIDEIVNEKETIPCIFLLLKVGLTQINRPLKPFGYLIHRLRSFINRLICLILLANRKKKLMDKSFCPYVSSAFLSLDSIYSVFIQRRKEEREGAGYVGKVY